MSLVSAQSVDCKSTIDTGLEKNGVKDPAVVRLADGTYLIVYVTEIP